MAGESADDVARRARERAARLIQRAEAFEKGAAGERAVQAMLDTLPDRWTVFHDVRWPGRPRANIDHLVVGPTGVYVIDAKNWSGQITVRHGVLRQNGYARTPALRSVASASDAIAQLVPSLPRVLVESVLCFAGDSQVEAWVDGVLVCHVEHLNLLLTCGSPVLSEEWLQFLRFELDMSTTSACEPAPGPVLSAPPAAPPESPLPPARRRGWFQRLRSRRR